MGGKEVTAKRGEGIVMGEGRKPDFRLRDWKELVVGPLTTFIS
jgi:hypothetical protein